MIDASVVTSILLIAHVVVVLVAAVVISANRRPSSAIAWLLAIIFIPYIGAAAFFLVGFSTLPAGRRADQRHVTDLILKRTQGLDLVSHGDDWPQWLGSVVHMTRGLGALPMVGGNTARLFEDYNGTFAAMIEDIDRATKYVNVEYFILVKDASTTPFFEALARAKDRGVTVRVLFDHIASVATPGRRETQAYLSSTGIESHAMLPVRPWRGQWQRPDLRNHRKIVVIDGRVGYTGSQNLVDASYGKRGNLKRGLRWLELVVRLEGPAVRELDAVFVTDWYSETRVLLEVDTSPVMLTDAAEVLDAQVLPSGPSFDGDNNLKLFASLLHKAERRISITSPYFVPEESLMLAILTARARGVDVELFVSEVGDQALVYHAQRSYYEQLLRSGVRIYLYRTPTVLHSKHFAIDDDVAVIGSSNMDIRSFSLNMEVSVMVQGEAFVNELRVVEDHYRSQSRELQLEEWLVRPLGQKVLDNVARLTSALQ